MNNSSPSPQSASSGSDAALAHVVDIRVLLGVFAVLMVLTTITVSVSYFDFGALNLFVAISVATMKAALVALYFMHLRYDNLFYAFVLLVGVAFLGLFLSITMLDSVEYHPGVEAWQERTQ
ncbi:MAG: cytochrome C oxidase subunit IV family protein [Pirellulales bacterium]|nr:cytochrome C oxidase subunit IV family protein [Pirellulales bacterium]